MVLGLKGKILLPVLFLLFTTLANANYPDLSSNLTLNPGDVINITGGIKNSTDGYVANENITINFTSFNGTATSSSSGILSNFTAPTQPGEHNITIIYNGTSRKIPLWITNVSSLSTIEFTSLKPPYSAGNSFLINLTLKNNSGSTISNFTPLIEVFAANGLKQSWTITNTTNAAVHNGIITYNISIPSDSNGGNFALIVEKGRVVTYLYLLSGYVMSVNIQTLQNETRSNYALSSQINILAKIRDTDGNPISNATQAIAVITYPNGTVVNYSLSNASDSGKYNITITAPSISGEYNVLAEANVSGTLLESSIVFTLKSISASLETQKEFFREWGDAEAITPGSDVAFNLIIVNLSDDSAFTGSTEGGSSQVNCSSVTLISLSNAVNGSAITASITSSASGIFSGTTVCKISFAAPNTTGTYRIRVNGTVGSNLQATADGYFSVQNYFMKPTTVSSLGGDFDFVVMVLAGSNVTFQISAFNLLQNREVSGINITNVSVVMLKPLMFASSSSNILEGQRGLTTTFNVTASTNGTTSEVPTITIELPVNRTGPFIAEITAIINGTTPETITGRAFFMSKYVMGFLSNSGRSEGMGGEGGGGFGSSSSCAGTETFTGDVKDLNGNNNAQGVEFVNILEARQEETGTSISSCLSMSRNVTDSSGKINLSLTFSSSGTCGSLSGFHMVIFNVTYQGRTDEVPAGFNCKRLQFFPNPSQWNVDPNSPVNFTINNVQRLNDSLRISNGTVQIVRGFNFNPSSGPKVLTANGTLNFNLSGGNATYVLYPSNFSLSKWPNGFVDTTPRVTASAAEGSTSDTSFGGFSVSPFMVRIDSVNGQNAFGQTFSSGQNLSIRVWASTNVSRINYSTLINGNTTTTGFQLKFGLPYQGKLKPLTVNSAVLISDGWNTTSDSFSFTGVEIWEVNTTIPSDVKKGSNMLSIIVNNSLSDEAEGQPPIWMSIKTFSVQVGMEEGVQMTRFYSTNFPDQNESLYTEFAFNTSVLDADYNIRSKSGLVCARLGFNSTIYSNNNQLITYGADTKILIVDNGTAGVYDTVVLNVTIAPGVTQLKFLRQLQNLTTIYVWKIDDCGFFKIINATRTRQNAFDSWGGTYQKSTIFTIPYIVKNPATSAPLEGITVGLNAIIKQQDSTGGGSGGTGFNGKVDPSAYTSSIGNTDQNGLAFLTANVSGASGSMMMFWKLNTTDGRTDTASFGGYEFGGASGTQVQIRNFDTFGGRAARMNETNNNANVVATLYPFNTTTVKNVWNYTDLSENITVYNGTVRIGNITYYTIYDPTTNKIAMDDDNNINNTMFNSDSLGSETGNEESIDTKNKTIRIGQNNYDATEIRVVENNTLIAIHNENNAYQYPISSSGSNVTVRICAQDYSRPANGIENVSVYIFAQDYSSWPPSSVTLQWHDPINGTLYSFNDRNATTGPKGCVALDINHPTGWPSRPTGLQATLVRNTGTENQTETTWADNVYNSNGG